jgi:protocatechuate 4,5-dioxygenase alpha chain
MTGDEMETRNPVDWGIPGTYPFDYTRSRMGYSFNKMCMSLTNAENREAFKADMEAYMTKYGLTEEQKQAVREQNWLRLIKDLGANVYLTIKVAECMGVGLYTMGAQQRGESLEEFLQTRSGKGAV